MSNTHPPDTHHHHHDGSESEATGTSLSGHKSEQQPVLAKQETRAVNTLRLLVLLVLVTVATTVSLAVFFYTRDSEQETFETRFADQAQKVIDAFQTNADRRLAALQAFSQQVTSHAVSQGETFPNVTLPDFEQQAAYTLKLAEVVALLILPIVSKQNRAGYEAYSVANQGWLKEGLALQEASTTQTEAADKEDLERLQEGFVDGDLLGKNESETLNANLGISPIIFKLGTGTQAAAETGPGPYTPIWQISPALPISVLINFNTMAHPARHRELVAFLRTGKILISAAADFLDDDPLTSGRKEVMNLFLNRYKEGEFEYDEGPVSDIYIPIYDSNGPDKKLASILTAYVYWQAYFSDILPDNANGIISVLKNTCNQSFTYQINGKDVTYLGKGDMHDTTYDNMGVETGFGAFLGLSTGKVEETLDAECHYNVIVYPSKEMEDDYLTMTPGIFTLVLVSVFLFTSTVFITYDRLVARRHKVVNGTAVRSTAVVQSLFPETVRDRLYENNDTSTNNDKKKKKAAFEDVSLSNSNGVDILVSESGASAPNIIADVYPETTVFFSDVVGFTKWASSRQPTEVFQLLETLFGEFDKIAKKKSVFKVETIGKLPTPHCASW